MQKFTWKSFGLRWCFAALLVFISWNPTGYSFSHWATSAPMFTPEKALAAIALIIAWVIYVRATMRSLGPVGVGLLAAIFACLVWLMFSRGWLSGENLNILTWIALFAGSTILAVGMSWSHVRRRLSGQVDTDDVDQ